jgi:pimeloyl-ACP methyl ester carboxylesterase
MVKNFLSRIVRFAFLLVVVYAFLLLYQAMNENHLAFSKGKDQAAALALAEKFPNSEKTCLMKDGEKLQGWVSGDSAPLTLYFGGSGEDVASTVLLLAGQVPGRLAAFNFRGSGTNEGRNSESHFKADVPEMLDCMGIAQGANFPVVLAGRGYGAIAAVNAAQQVKPQGLLLFSPFESVAQSLHSYYRVFYPEWLVRTDIRMDYANATQIPTTVIAIAGDTKTPPQLSEAVAKTLNAHFELAKNDTASVMSIVRKFYTNL